MIERVEAARVLFDVVRRADEPDAELLFPPLVDADAVLVRETGLELLRRLVEDVGEHESAGCRERGGRGRGERSPRQPHPRAARQQRRRVVRAPAAVAAAGRAAADLGGRAARRCRRWWSCRPDPASAPPALWAPARAWRAPAGAGLALLGGALGTSVIGFVSSAIFVFVSSSDVATPSHHSDYRHHPMTFRASSAACRTLMLRSC